MNILSNTLGINNIQNLRRGATGTQKLKNIGAFIGKTAGNILLAGGLLGGLAKAGSMGASIIREDMQVGFRRLGPLEKYGPRSTLARTFHPTFGKSVSRDAYNTALTKFFPRGQIKLSRNVAVATLSREEQVLSHLPPFIRYSDLKSQTFFQQMVLGTDRKIETLARIGEAREPEANAFYLARKQNSLFPLRHERYLNSVKNKELLFKNKFLVPKSFVSDFLEPPPSVLREVVPPLSQRTRELNQLFTDYLTRSDRSDYRCVLEKRFIEELFDEGLARRRFVDSLDVRDVMEYRQRSNFVDPFVVGKINRYDQIKVQQEWTAKFSALLAGIGVFSSITYLAYWLQKQNTNDTNDSS
jgi:hypothetical protein